jgi:hypothetical protein
MHHFLTIFCFATAVLEKMKMRVPYPYLVLSILMRRIRICCQNSLLMLGSMSLRGAKVRSLRATLVAQTREP